MIYDAKIDAWIAAVLGGAALFQFAGGAAVFALGPTANAPNPQVAAAIGSILAVSGVLTALLLWSCYNTRYEVTSSHLIVRFGPLHTSLPLDTIVEVFPTHNLLSAPAPSLDRLRINYRKRNGKMWFALISPKDKEGFVRDLVRAAPQLQPAGDGGLRFGGEEPA